MVSKICQIVWMEAEKGGAGEGDIAAAVCRASEQVTGTLEVQL